MAEAFDMGWDGTHHLLEDLNVLLICLVRSVDLVLYNYFRVEYVYVIIVKLD
jgi:hypothetical protein